MVDDDAPAIGGPALRAFRQARRMKQAHLAELLGVDQATVSRWERGGASPGEAARRGLRTLLAADPRTASDAVLRRLVETSALPVHLVCDLTHALLAASPAREREWGRGAGELLGTPLFRFATPAIEAAERRLSASGWHEGPSAAAVLATGAGRHPELRIAAGTLLWERLPLGDGRPARLVTTLPPTLPPPPGALSLDDPGPA